MRFRCSPFVLDFLAHTKQMSFILSKMTRLFCFVDNRRQMSNLLGMKTRLETRAMFAGYRPEEANMAVKPPLHPASTFVFPDARTGAAHMETAYGVESAGPRPTDSFTAAWATPPSGWRKARLAAWDDSENSALFASSMAAISTSLSHGRGRPPVWYVGPMYGGTHLAWTKSCPPWAAKCASWKGWTRWTSTWCRHRRRAGIIYLETPANPTMQIQRIRTAASDGHRRGSHRILVMVDNTSQAVFNVPWKRARTSCCTRPPSTSRATTTSSPVAPRARRRPSPR